MIGAVVPVCNRRDNLELMLASLEAQTVDDFAVVVADDGSTDGSRELVEDLARSPTWKRRLRWIGCGPDMGVRTGRARNIGAANLPTSVSLLIMLDSDLVLRPEAMSLFHQAHRAQPEAVVLGLVEWLPPLDRAMLRDAVRRGDLNPLRARVPRAKPVRVRGTFTGPELRGTLFERPAAAPIPLRPEWALPLNSGWPLTEYWRAGGFDESMQGYGYQDMDFGARAAQAGVTCLPRNDLWALHVWHPKPSQAMLENQRNLDRYLRTHGEYLRQHAPADDLEVDVDWGLWWHYHADRGGAVVRAANQLWALSRNRRHRIALPDECWLRDLGHSPDGFTTIPAAVVEKIIDHGTAGK
ncbi:MAG: glycosyltransferase family 2 protein [Pseudonocardiaceae bacterium]